jgi:2-(1,2-epoxy-1,2-dihydrophenyl)acetyl-CoA isomerase
VDFQDLTYEVTNSVAEITMNRPEKLNALTGQLREEITAAFGVANDDPGVRAVIITGAGRGFCSGADLSAGGGEREPWAGVGPAGGLGRMAIAIRSCGKPTIAAVNGAAAGAGLAIALACDIRIASDLARFAAIFVRRGIMPDTGTSFLLPQVVRMDYALKMLMTGEILDAATADRYGLCTEVVPPDRLLPRARELAAQIAAGAPIAIALARKAAYLNQYRELTSALIVEDRFVDICNASEDQAEGVRAFLEKRDPVFTGR